MSKITKSQNYIIASSLGKMKQVEALPNYIPENVYMVTRSDRNAEYAKSKGWNYTPSLSPSWQLFNWTKGKKEQNNWSQEQFNTGYRPKFVQQLKEPIAYKDLSGLVTKLNNGETIVLICYCSNYEMCHTRILCDILSKFTGVDIIRNE